MSERELIAMMAATLAQGDPVLPPKTAVNMAEGILREIDARAEDRREPPPAP